MESTPELAAGRRKVFLLAFLTALCLVFTGCANAGNQEDTADDAASSSASESFSSDCASGPAATSSSCEAAGPGTTASADRCPATSPTPLAGGVVEGTFGPWCENAIATSYATSNTEALIPEGAEAELTMQETDMDTTVDMQVQGFPANVTYTAMLHNGACTESAAGIGPEFVHEGSGDNPDSNLALDFTTEEDGSASAAVTVPFLVPDKASGDSFVLHDANMAVVGCLRVP